MPSLTEHSYTRMGQPAVRYSILVGIMLTACSTLLPPDRNATLFPPLASTDLCKVVDGTPTPREARILSALRSNVESGPLYTIPAAAGVSACNASVGSGVITLEYRFKDGGQLHVKRDSRIEYTEQVTRVHLAREKNPVAILADAERIAFGPGGCGIDWQKAGTRAVADDAGATETLFYGNVCNCRTGFRRDTAGHVIELMLRSAC